MKRKLTYTIWADIGQKIMLVTKCSFEQSHDYINDIAGEGRKGSGLPLYRAPFGEEVLLDYLPRARPNHD